MADAAVELVLNNLKEVVDQHSHLIGDNSRHIERLQRDLLMFNAFLKDSVEKRRNDEQTKVMVREIREVVYEVEDIMDTFVNKTIAMNRGISLLLPKFLRTPLDLHAVGQQVEKVRHRVEQARAEMELLSHEDISQQSQNRPPSKKDHVVGFEDVAKDLINRLTRDSDCVEVISIIGMVGLGKSTLAWKVYSDPDIIYKFHIRIWLYITQEFSDKDIFISILEKITTVTEDIRSKENHEIADLVTTCLQRGSFLIVMDDVWETAHWRRLDAALPKNNNKGKVLITSRNEAVGNFASTSPGSIIRLRYLTEEENWWLLRLEALNTTTDCPPNLENVGRIIAKNCVGLPLAAVIIGGILAEKSKDLNTSEMVNEWDKVSKLVSTYLSDYDPENNMRKLISLSYDILSYHLRSCFLYLGMFPEDYEIPASKLIRMWIGEGFIQHSESRSLEEVGEKYLEELINRNLVKSEKFKHDGKIKTCRIQDHLRDFCRTEAANENLVKEIKYVSGEFTPPIPDIDKYRRLSIHSNCLEFISSKPSCPHVRSFVCFSKDKLIVDKQNSAKIFKAFKFLKVLDVEPFKFEKIDTDIYQMVCMRYLVLSSNLSILPSKFCQFWNLRTLIVDTTSRTLEVKADIWKMSKLRYFKTNASAILPKPSESSDHGKELQTLGTISVESCTPELFNQASNLKKLGIRGNLRLLLDGSIESFDSLGKMEHIEKLKLINDVYPFPSSERPLQALPPHHQFPSGLMSLTLRATFLSWDAMSTLRLLWKLKVLKLKENAFMGAIWNWNADDIGGFKCLQLLHIEDTDLIIWKASSLHYPNLRSLVLRNCEKLLAIPIGMADIPNLKTLDLYYCESAAASAMAIKEEKRKTQLEGSAFMLSIFPPNYEL